MELDGLVWIDLNGLFHGPEERERTECLFIPAWRGERPFRSPWP